MSSIVNFVGWAAAFSGAMLGVPQLIRMIHVRSVDGVSLIAWQAMLVVSLAWSIYGLTHSILEISISNLVLSATSAIVLERIIRYTASNVFRLLVVWILPSLAALLVILTYRIFGVLVFSILVLVIESFVPTAQIRRMFKVSDITGVSTGWLVLNLLCQVLWILFAVPTHQTAILYVNSPLAAIAMVMLALNWVRRRAIKLTAFRT